MADEEAEDKPEEVKAPSYQFPLIRYTDMNTDIANDVLDLAQLGFDANTTNWKEASKMIKKQMDTKYGPPYNVVLGEAFGFEVEYKKGTVFYAFIGGAVGVVIWKS